jgi:GT2 family glycosyltransferase
MRPVIKIKRRFEDSGRVYFPGEVLTSIYEVARRYVSRGDAEFVTGGEIDITGGFLRHPKVSIVILVKDALGYVKNCIRSLNTYTSNFELIIVDNGSNQETKEWLENFGWLDFTLITNKKNMGFSYGCNQGIKAAKYDYVCLLNSDTLLSPNWLGKLMRGFKYSKDIGIVGPSTCHSATIQSPQVFKNFRTADQYTVNRIAGMCREDYLESAVVGFCFVIKKEVFEKIGVFDYKRYGIACHEDIDLVWRAGKAGFKSLWCKGSYVHHFGNRTTREMGLDPKAIRVKNQKVFNERLSSSDLYVENDVEIKEIEEKKGLIPILMITWNRLEYTKKAIEAVKENSDLPCHLFIWDNGSTDGTVEYLRSVRPSIKNHVGIAGYFSDKNTGLVPPMNYFFKKFKDYRYTAKVDNDTVVSPNWLSKIKKPMDEFPLFAVEADHYLMLAYDIKTNDDYYKHLFSVDYEGGKLYFSDIVGGTGTIIRTSLVEEIPEKQGTLSGWIQYQSQLQMVSAFYTGVWIDRLDQTGTNKYKEVSDYPGYDNLINKLRPRNKISSRTIKEETFLNVKKRMEDWYNAL